jgi:hypothetical protein
MMFGDTSTRLHLQMMWKAKGPLEMKLPMKESINQDNWLTMHRLGAMHM